MKIVIDISEDVYTRLFDNGIQDNEIAVDDVCEMARAIRLGIPLPKGHGRLGDLDIILNKALKHRENYMEAENSSYCRGKLHAYEVYVEEVDNAPTIIEADGGDAV